MQQNTFDIQVKVTQDSKQRRNEMQFCQNVDEYMHNQNIIESNATIDLDG